MVQPNGICNKCKHEIEHGECISCGSLEAVNWFRAWDKQDNVNPSHYTKMAISPHKFIADNAIPWSEGQVIKYISRWQNKNGLEDLRKAQWYLDDLIKRVEDGSYKK